MNMHTLEMGPDVTFEDVKFYAEKNKLWCLAEVEAQYVVFCIRCESFKIYAQEWVNWVKTYGLKAEELGMVVSANYELVVIDYQCWKSHTWVVCSTVPHARNTLWPKTAVFQLCPN